MKARIQAKQSFVRNTRIGFSNTHRKAGIFDSSLERDYFEWKRFELPADSGFMMQPVHTEYIDINGILQRYTPDAEYSVDPINYIDEVKYVKDALIPVNQVKHSLLAKHYIAEDENNVFRVVTEEDIRVGHRVDNIRQLNASTLHEPPLDLFNELVKGIAWKRLHISLLQEASNKKKLPLWLVKRCIAHKLFTCDLTQHWSNLVLSWK
jgi:hypothetical protein